MPKKTSVKSIKLITIDGDGCLFSYNGSSSSFFSSWDALSYAYGLREIWGARIRRYYQPGTDDLKWARQDAADLKGKKVSDCYSTLYPIPYCAGAKEFSKLSRGVVIRGLLSSSIDLVAHKASEELGFDFVICNIFHQENGFFTGTHDHIVPLWRKHERLYDLCKHYGLKPEEICHIGDNENDLGVAERAGMFIALNPKRESVRAAADYVAEDFFDIIKIFRLKEKKVN